MWRASKSDAARAEASLTRQSSRGLRAAAKVEASKGKKGRRASITLTSGDAYGLLVRHGPLGGPSNSVRREGFRTL